MSLLQFVHTSQQDMHVHPLWLHCLCGRTHGDSGDSVREGKPLSARAEQCAVRGQTGWPEGAGL